MNIAAPLIVYAPTFVCGDALACLELVASQSVDCVVTSPPYWNLRDYGVAGQIGLEPTMTGYLETMVGLCRDLRRVLKPSGTFWLNIGDSYARDPGKGQHKPGDAGKHAYVIERGGGRSSNTCVPTGLKAKDLCMIPNRLAIALQDDGWYVRSEIIWHKPNPMPESVTDRPTSAHEKIWLLTKSSRYFYDADAVRENRTSNEDAKTFRGGCYVGGNIDNATMGKRQIVGNRIVDKQRGHGRRHAGFNDRWDHMTKEEQTALGRNARNVWTIAPAPFRGAHFATFPPELVTRCVSAGCPLGGLVLDPFSGSGTTALAAYRLGRRSLNFEINADYIELARERLKREGNKC